MSPNRRRKCGAVYADTARREVQVEASESSASLFVFFVIMVMVMGAVAISMNVRLEEQERAHVVVRLLERQYGDHRFLQG